MNSIRFLSATCKKPEKDYFYWVRKMHSLEETLDKSHEQELLSKSQPTESNSDFFGPILPPHFLQENLLEDKKTKKICVPTLSDQFSEKKEKESKKFKIPGVEPEVKILIGPELPEFLKYNQSSSEIGDTSTSTADDKDLFGPSTTLMTEGDVTNYKFINKQNLSEKSLNTDESKSKREQWMTELPKKKNVNFGLFPRHFRTRIQTDKESDDSVWTDTPADKKKKEHHKKRKDHKEILHLKRLKERDEEMEKLTKKIEKKLNKRQSLLEMHLKNMKKKKKKEEKKGKSLPERRPFDRNVDLQIPKFDENQKKAILNKSRFLNDRFAPGQSKYL